MALSRSNRSSVTPAHGVCAAAAYASAAVTLLIFGFMAALGLPLLRDGRFFQTLLGAWSPVHHRYGIYPMIWGTLSITGLGFSLALPMSLGCAAFIQVTAPKGVARIFHHLVRLMTGIPTVIYGFVGIFLLVPLVREGFGRGSGLCILSAGLMLAVLVAPTMILFFSDGLAGVALKHRLAASALGATRVQRLLYILLPQAWRSIVAGMVLGLGRALGDTMIALMLSGNAVALPSSVLDAARTLTAHIALVIAADFDSPEFGSLFICGLVLYLATTIAVIAMRAIVAKRLERA